MAQSVIVEASALLTTFLTLISGPAEGAKEKR
jgi:hypothetical protein